MAMQFLGWSLTYVFSITLIHMANACLYIMSIHIGSMVLLYMVTFTINIPPVMLYTIYTIHGSVMGYTSIPCICSCTPRQNLDLRDSPWFNQPTQKTHDPKKNKSMGWWRLYQYNINIMKAYWPPTVTLVYPFLIFLNSSESSILRGVTEMGGGVGGAIPLTITCKWGKKNTNKYPNQVVQQLHPQINMYPLVI